MDTSLVDSSATIAVFATLAANSRYKYLTDIEHLLATGDYGDATIMLGYNIDSMANTTGDGGAATNAEFSTPGDLSVDSYGNVIICDGYNNAIRRVSSASGIITTIAGNGTAGYFGDGGLAVNAKVNNPYGVFIEKNNDIYFSDCNNGAIRKIDGSSGIISTVVGCGLRGFSGDGGPAMSATLRPDDVVIGDNGIMYIADYGNHRIRMVYNSQLGVPENFNMSEVNIYPNPAQNELNIEYHFTNNEDATWQIADITGRVIVVKNLISGKQKEVMDIRSFSQGVYLYRVVQNNIPISTGRIIKE